MDTFVSMDTLMELSRRLDNDWKKVARRLKITEHQIDNIKRDCPSQKERCYQMFLHWKRYNDEDATYRVLSDALNNAGRPDLGDFVLYIVLEMEGNGASLNPNWDSLYFKDPAILNRSGASYNPTPKMESYSEKTSGVGEDQRKDYRRILVDVAKTLTEKDVEWLRFECDIDRADADQISDGVKLMDKLESKCFITPDNVDDLIELLERRQLNKSANILKKYKGTKTQIQNESTSVHPSTSTSVATAVSGPPITSRMIPSSVVGDDFIRDISKHIGNDWKNVGRELGISKTDLDNITADINGQKEKAIEMLFKWRNMHGDAATYKRLSDAFENAKRADLKQHFK